ncbi:hypothetical protein BMS3Bbin03_02658 [bacterium BMS3Bbin03]|nr:hypothetical protein BMS3Bbin03_02658 [bacterium BMS3Bbin03]
MKIRIIRAVRLKSFVWCGSFLLLLFAGLARAESGKVSVQSAVDRAQITIGDVITYTVTVSRDRDVRVKLPGLAENLGQFEIRDYKVFDPVKKDGKIINRVQYKISTFDIGDFKIPPIAITYTIPPDTVQHVLKSEAIKIHVESVAPSAEGDIKGIKPPVELPFDWRPYVKNGLFGLLGLLILGAMIYVWIRKRAGKPLIPQKAEPPRPPHEAALKALERLQNSGLLEKGHVKKYYSEVSEIIRRYIEGRYGIDAMDLTTTELLGELGQIPLSEEQMRAVTDFSDLCDLVKFAKYIPMEDEHQNILKIAFQFVRETMVPDETSEAENGRGTGASTEMEAAVPAEVSEAEEGVVDFKRNLSGKNGAESTGDFRKKEFGD